MYNSQCIRNGHQHHYHKDLQADTCTYSEIFTNSGVPLYSILVTIINGHQHHHRAEWEKTGLWVVHLMQKNTIMVTRTKSENLIFCGDVLSGCQYWWPLEMGINIIMSKWEKTRVHLMQKKTMNDRQSLCNLNSVQRKLSQSHKRRMVTSSRALIEIMWRSLGLRSIFFLEHLIPNKELGEI